MSETALTLAELKVKILRQLKEDTTGSAAFPDELLEDTINEIYEESFNQPNKQIKIRTTELEFITAIDNTLNGALAIGDTSIVLNTDSSVLPSTGRILIENEFIDYTANDDVYTLTCAAGAILQTHDDGKTVRPCYALPSAMDEERVQYINVNGLQYDIVDIAEMLDTYKSNYRHFAIHEDYLLLPENSSVLGATMFYTPVLTRMDTGTDIPTLIPNNFRVPLLVNGSVGKLMLLDSQRGWEVYTEKFNRALKMFYAGYGRQSDMRNKRTSKSIYD